MAQCRVRVTEAKCGIAWVYDLFALFCLKKHSECLKTLR